MHFESFPALRLHVTPPITQVARQLREEALDLFYQSCKVSIAVSLSAEPGDLHLRLPPTGPIQFTEYTDRIFSHFPEGKLGLLRKFQINGVVVCGSACVDTTWNVDLGSGRNQVYISSGRARAETWYVPSGFEAGRKMAEDSIRAEMEAIMAREGQSKLLRDDLGTFRRIFAPKDGE